MIFVFGSGGGDGRGNDQIDVVDVFLSFDVHRILRNLFSSIIAAAASIAAVVGRGGIHGSPDGFFFACLGVRQRRGDGVVDMLFSNAGSYFSPVCFLLRRHDAYIDGGIGDDRSRVFGGYGGDGLHRTEAGGDFVGGERFGTSSEVDFADVDMPMRRLLRQAWPGSVRSWRCGVVSAVRIVVGFGVIIAGGRLLVVIIIGRRSAHAIRGRLYGRGSAGCSMRRSIGICISLRFGARGGCRSKAPGFGGGVDGTFCFHRFWSVSGGGGGGAADNAFRRPRWLERRRWRIAILRRIGVCRARTRSAPGRWFLGRGSRRRRR